jgi:hypothetical protein
MAGKDGSKQRICDPEPDRTRPLETATDPAFGVRTGSETETRAR